MSKTATLCSAVCLCLVYHFILDGHTTHVMNVAVVELQRADYTEIHILLPHCNPNLKTLDVSFTRPLNSFYVHEIKK